MSFLFPSTPSMENGASRRRLGTKFTETTPVSFSRDETQVGLESLFSHLNISNQSNNFNLQPTPYSYQSAYLYNDPFYPDDYLLGGGGGGGGRDGLLPSWQSGGLSPSVQSNGMTNPVWPSMTTRMSLQDQYQHYYSPFMAGSDSFASYGAPHMTQPGLNPARFLNVNGGGSRRGPHSQSRSGVNSVRSSSNLYNRNSTNHNNNYNINNNNVVVSGGVSGGGVNRRAAANWLTEPLNRLSFEDLRGEIMGLARDQEGCKLLQRAMERLSREEIKGVFMELINHVGELMLDQFGNYVVQKLVEVCTEEQRTQVLLMITQNDFQLVTICLNIHGTRAVQTLLEHITTSHQVSIVMKAISPGAVALTKDVNGHHVIQHCLKHFSSEDNKHLLNEVAKNCFSIATDRSGCCVLQQCVENSQGETRDRLVAEITANAVLLSEDHYGNYVVQHVLGLKVPKITANLTRQLEGHYMALSCNKYASNVVEKCLVETTEEQSTRIIWELMNHPNFPMLMTDPYGNFVIQSALSVSRGRVHDALRLFIEMHAPVIRSNMYGKKVLGWNGEKKKKLLHM